MSTIGDELKFDKHILETSSNAGRKLSTLAQISKLIQFRK